MSRPSWRRAVAGFAVLAAASGLPAAAATAAVPRAATRTICVGLLIDATAGGGSRSTGCAKVPPGSSGVDVLEAAGHTVTTQDNGDFVCAIDGVPASGCSGVDSSHYWSYWHRAAGASTWTYSASGAGTYQPAAGSTEGWVYDAGTTRRPGGVGRLCPVASPSRSAAPAPRHTRSAAPAPATGRSRAASPTVTATVVPTPSPAGRRHAARVRAAASPRSATRTGRHHPRRNIGTARTRPPAGATTTAAGTPGATVDPGSAAAGATVSPPPGSGGSAIWLVVVAVVAAAGLGGTAWWRARRAPP